MGGACINYTDQCFGFRVWDDSANALYYMDRLTWDNTADGTASSPDVSTWTVPIGGIANIATQPLPDNAMLTGTTAGATFGFDETKWYSIADDWQALSAGALFYRFQKITASPKYFIGGTMEIWSFSAIATPIAN